MLTRAKRRRQVEEDEGPSSAISPQYGIEHARIIKAKSELVVNVKRELTTFGLNMNGKKEDLVDHLAHHKNLLQKGSPFDRLPDELVLKILKMAAWRRSPETVIYYEEEAATHDCYDQMWFSTHDYDFILMSLCRVSVRFNRICQDTSLWEDIITIRYSVDDDILDFLHDGVEKVLLIRSRLNQSPRYKIKPEVVTALASKYPNLEILMTSFESNADRGCIFSVHADQRCPWILRERHTKYFSFLEYGHELYYAACTYCYEAPDESDE